MNEESLLLLSDLQKLINQVVLIDYTIIILGGIRMKPKKFVQIYGKVVLPIIRGMTVRYFSNGTWKETARVRRVIEVTDAYIKFETDRIRYCIDFGMVEDNAMPIAA